MKAKLSISSKHKKVYSGLDAIPRGQAGPDLIEGCLVLEGGAFRSLYTQGFIDAMMENNLNLSCVIGVSAGALSGMSYVSGQIGRAARFNLGYRHDSRYVGVKALMRRHSIVDVGFATDDDIMEPLNTERFNRPEQRFVAVTANCATGKTAYFEKGHCSNILLAVRASATMPYISPVVRIDGVPHLDGGCTCKVPYQWAIDEGYEKIIVIRTRESSYRKEEKYSEAALKVYGRYPEFARSLAVSSIMCNRQFEEIEQLHKSGRLLRMAPSEPVHVSRIEGDMEKLGALYYLGREDCLRELETMRTYLGQGRS